MNTSCKDCQKLKEDLNDAKKKLGEFKHLASKIIQADSLIRKYTDKESECKKLTDELNEKKKEISNIKTQLKTVTKENESLNKVNSDLNKEKQECEKKINEYVNLMNESTKTESELNEKVKEYVQKHDNQKNEISDLKEEIKQLKKNLESVSLEFEKLKSSNQNIIKNQQQQPQNQQQPTRILGINKSSTQILNAHFAETSVFQQQKKIETVPDSNEPEKTAEKITFFLESDESLSSSSTEDVTKSKETAIVATKREQVFDLDDDDDDDDKSDQESGEISSNMQAKKMENEPEKKSDEKTPTVSNKDVYSELFDEIDENSIDVNTPSSSSSSSSSSSDDDDDDNTSDTSSSTTDAQEDDEKIIFNESQQNIDVSDIQRECEKELADQASTQSPNQDQQLGLEVENERLENEKIDACLDAHLSNVLDQLINHVADEYSVLDLVRDKIINDEINSRNSQTCEWFKTIGSEVIKEEHQARQALEKKLKEEIKLKMEHSIADEMFNLVVDNLMKECCERVIWEFKIERQNMKINAVYDDLLDAYLKEIVETLLFENIFDEMCHLKPLINKLPVVDSEHKHFNDRKRPYPTHERTPFGRGQYSRQIENEKLKKIRLESAKTSPIMSSISTFGPIENISSSDTVKIDEYFKEFLGDYFRKFNFKVGFTFEELDDLIDRLANNLTDQKNTGSQDVISIVVSRILVKHYLNNRFIPLDEYKLNQVDENELILFKKIKYANNPNTSQSYLNYLQNKIDQMLTIKITNEEEKYVYLLKKLREHSHFELVLDHFLNCIKLMIFKAEFTDSFNMRMGRMIGFLCKASKNAQYIKCFIFDLISTAHSLMPLRFQNLILLLVRIWHESLDWPCSSSDIDKMDFDFETSAIKNPILCAVIHIVKDSMHKNNKLLDEKYKPRDVKHADFTMYYIYILETLSNWISTHKNYDEMCSFFLENLSLYGHLVNEENLFILNSEEFKLNEVMFEYLHAFQLVSTNAGWEWTEKFITEKLKPTMDELKKYTNTGTASKCDELLAFYYILLANILSKLCTKNDFSKYKNYLLNDLDLESNTDNTHDKMILEFSKVESIMLLCVFDAQNLLDKLNKWLMRQKKLAGSMSNSTKTKLTYVFKLYNFNSSNIRSLV